MNKVGVILTFACLALFLSVNLVHADVNVQFDVCEGGRVELEIEAIMNSTLYLEVIQDNVLNETAVIKAVNASSVEIEFDDTAYLVRITCSITDNRVKEEIDAEKTIRKVKFEIEWINFALPLTRELSINFAEFLSRVSVWNRTDNGYAYSTNGDYGKMFFKIVGPSSTMNFYITKGTVVFELPLSKTDQFINSPYILLIIVIIVVLIANIYRKLRYG